MKKAIALLLALLLLFALAACEKPADGAEETGKTGEETGETAKTAAWELTQNGELTKDAQSAFDKAMQGLTGVNYTPLVLLAVRETGKTEYCLLCEARVVYPGAQPYYAFVTVVGDEIARIVALDIGEIAESGEVTDVPPSNEPRMGGWTVNREDSVAAEGAVMHLASQVVAGTNHCVLCRGEGWHLAFLYEDLNGNVELTKSVSLDISSLTAPNESE